MRARENGGAEIRVNGVPLVADTERYYVGLFRYPNSGFLYPHVDAGICPINGLRKHVTAIMYLSGGESGFQSLAVILNGLYLIFRSL